MARKALPRFDVIPFRRPVSELPAAVDGGDVPWFRIVLTALDTAAARRDAQRLWPDRLIDAGTGDTLLETTTMSTAAGRALYACSLLTAPAPPPPSGSPR